MSAIIFLIIIGIIVAGGFLVAFVWAVKSGQYDDDYSPSVRMLFDNQPDGDKIKPGKPDNEDKKTSEEDSLTK